MVFSRSRVHFPAQKSTVVAEAKLRKIQNSNIQKEKLGKFFA